MPADFNEMRGLSVADAKLVDSMILYSTRLVSGTKQGSDHKVPKHTRDAG